MPPRFFFVLGRFQSVSSSCFPQPSLWKLKPRTRALRLNLQPGLLRALESNFLLIKFTINTLPTPTSATLPLSFFVLCSASSLPYVILILYESREIQLTDIMRVLFIALSGRRAHFTLTTLFNWSRSPRLWSGYDKTVLSWYKQQSKDKYFLRHSQVSSGKEASVASYLWKHLFFFYNHWPWQRRSKVHTSAARPRRFVCVYTRATCSMQRDDRH